MRSVPLFLVPIVLALLPSIGAAQAIDCQTHIAAAQGAIDKVSDDMKGMESLPKDQLLYVHTLVADARMLLDGAHHDCDQPQADYDRARAIAKAEAARGSAEAADILHWHFMKSMPGTKPSASMPGMNMPGMKK